MADRGSLRVRIQSGDLLTGAILRMPNLTLVEVAGLAGLDFLILDCEHGPAEETGLHHHLLAAASVGLPVLVRIGGDSSAEVLRVLDLGVAGLVVPHVSNAERAAWAAAVAHYPPIGSRGFALYTRAGGYGLTSAADHLTKAGQETIIVAMIEDRAACNNIDEIAAVGGIDAIFLGPADLAVDLGAVGKSDAREVTEAIDMVAAGASRAGCALMAIVGNEDAAREARDRGATLIVYNLQAAVTALVQRLADAGPSHDVQRP